MYPNYNKYTMNENQQYAATKIRELLYNIGTQYNNTTERVLYQQGVLIAILASLSANDSINFELTIKKLKQLT